VAKKEGPPEKRRTSLLVGTFVFLLMIFSYSVIDKTIAKLGLKGKDREAKSQHLT
jgi:hypothetical protein